MSKYGEFEVVRTAMIKCKRANDPNVDANGMREYSYLKCPHCQTEDIELPTSNIFRQKFSAIKDHIVTCPSFTGDRPVKRGKASASSAALSTAVAAATAATVATAAATSTAMVVANNNRDELAELKFEMEEMKRKDEEKDRRLEKLEDKTSLYDSVLEAVMPSLALPLTAPAERAKITLREAAIKDIAHNPLALPAPTDAIPREMHTAMMEQKNAMIAVEKERREELKEAHTAALDSYKKEIEAKDSELTKTELEKREIEKQMHEMGKTMNSLSTRADRLQKERDALNAKYNAALKGHEQAVRSHGKHGSSQLSKLQQGQKRAMAEVVMEAQTAAAVAFEREFAAKRARVN